MSNQHDLELNAYLDGEMSAAQVSEFENLLAESPQLRDRLQELKQLKSAMSGCYQTESKLPASHSGQTKKPVWQMVAAVLLLVTGFIAGSLIDVTSEDRFVLIGNEGPVNSPAVSQSEETRIVFHLTNPDQVVAGDLLDEVEQMLTSFNRQTLPLRIEIVSHGEGLGLLRDRLSQHHERIARLADSYENLVFVACQNTIDRLRVERGIEVVLLPEAITIDSGVSHVVKRQMEGWSYIRV